MSFAYVNPEDLVLPQSTIPPPPQPTPPTTPAPTQPATRDPLGKSEGGFFSNFFTNVVVSLIGAVLLLLLLMATNSPLLQPSVAGLNPALTRMVLGSSSSPSSDRLFEIFLITFVGALAICTVVN